MDPRNDLQLANSRRADFERRAAERRLARSVRAPRRLALPRFRPTAPAPRTTNPPLSCCPA